MPQKRKALESGKIYHVWTHANGDENLFRSDDDYGYFLEKYLYHLCPVVQTYAYCLMPNHLHLMIRVRKENEVLDYLRKKKGKPDLQGFDNLGGFSKVIAQQFSNLFNAYAKAYNLRYDRMGSLFVPNFRRKQIDSDEYYLKLIIYIHSNPVHHGFVKHPAEWVYSSWHAYIRNMETRTQKSDVLKWLIGRDRFERLHLDKNIDELVSELERSKADR